MCLKVALPIALLTLFMCLMNFTFSLVQVITTSKLMASERLNLTLLPCFKAPTKLNLTRKCTGNWQEVALEDFTYLLHPESSLQTIYVFPDLLSCTICAVI